jgi:hypothetical protein
LGTHGTIADNGYLKKYQQQKQKEIFPGILPHRKVTVESQSLHFSGIFSTPHHAAHVGSALCT